MSAERRLGAQLAFIEEIDRLKNIERRSRLFDGSRRENSAEHSWHVAIAALVLAEHADEKIDVSRVVAMLLLHDLVEIDAGDTFLYDETAAAEKTERESRAAARLFGLLPDEQGRHFAALWCEFEDGKTREARFAAAIDRVLPVLHNTHHRGALWREHGVSQARVVAKNRGIGRAAPRLWTAIHRRIREVFPPTEDDVAPGRSST